MRRSFVLAGTGLLCSLSVLPLVRAQDAKLLPLLESKNQQIEHAIVKGDLTPVRRLFAANVAIVNPAGGLVGYDDFQALLQSGTLKYKAIEPNQLKLIPMGKIAVLIYLSNDAGTMQGHDITGKVRRTEVWSQESGEWKIVAVQSTPVVAQPQR